MINPHEKDLGMKPCPECGSNAELYSVCCGAAIDKDTLICHACKDHSEIEVCEMCGGTGKIPKTEEDLREESFDRMLDAADRKYECDNDK